MSELRNILNSEFDDYGMSWKVKSIDRDTGLYTCNIDITFYNGSVRSLWFRVTKEVIEVELGEDCYQEVESYSYSSRYLWMAVLDYPRDQS